MGYSIVGQVRCQFLQLQRFRKRIFAENFLVKVASVVRCSIHFAMDTQHSIFQNHFCPEMRDLLFFFYFIFSQKQYLHWTSSGRNPLISMFNWKVASSLLILLDSIARPRRFLQRCMNGFSISQIRHRIGGSKQFASSLKCLKKPVLF